MASDAVHGINSLVSSKSDQDGKSSNTNAVEPIKEHGIDVYHVTPKKLDVYDEVPNAILSKGASVSSSIGGNVGLGIGSGVGMGVGADAGAGMGGGWTEIIDDDDDVSDSDEEIHVKIKVEKKETE